MKIKKKQKIKNHELEEQTIAGFCWYQPDQWERLVEINEDRDELDDCYEDWLKSANKAISEIRAKGIIVKKVKIDLEEFVEWCEEFGHSINSSARSEFVLNKVAEKAS